MPVLLIPVAVLGYKMWQKHRSKTVGPMEEMDNKESQEQMLVTEEDEKDQQEEFEFISSDQVLSSSNSRLTDLIFNSSGRRPPVVQSSSLSDNPAERTTQTSCEIWSEPNQDRMVGFSRKNCSTTLDDTLLDDDPTFDDTHICLTCSIDEPTQSLSNTSNCECRVSAVEIKLDDNKSDCSDEEPQMKAPPAATSPVSIGQRVTGNSPSAHTVSLKNRSGSRLKRFIRRHILLEDDSGNESRFSRKSPCPKFPSTE